jgi:hypothetical protein
MWLHKAGATCGKCNNLGFLTKKIRPFQFFLAICEACRHWVKPKSNVSPPCLISKSRLQNRFLQQATCSLEVDQVNNMTRGVFN